ncbi:MAG: hypothetical protein JST93_21100 [Acidobacteria bacterium]|nr:hypothetical protein [Acidobacteriota bacterium]
MATPQQVIANQANAQLSTGPRTEAGKAASAQNSCKYGLSARYVPLSPEERPLFEQLEADLRSQINPQGVLQEIFFRDLTAAAWKLSIIDRLLIAAGATTGMLLADEIPDRVRKLLRHKADQHRAFLRAYRLLQENQTAAARRAPEEPPSLAKPLPITKRTQPPPLSREQLAKLCALPFPLSAVRSDAGLQAGG